MKLISMPNDEFRLGDALVEALQDARYSNFEAAIAFVKTSGVKHLKEPLERFLARNGKISITIGIDQHGTSREALEQLLAVVSNTDSQLRVYHNENESTFHTKLYLVHGDAGALLFIGSSNLTEGGLFTNYEVDLCVELDFSNKSDRTLFDQARNILQSYASDPSGLSQELNTELLDQLTQQSQVHTEAFLAQRRKSERTIEELAESADQQENIFPRIKVRAAPRNVSVRSAASKVPEYVPSQNEGFVMTLMQTDAGRGQKTPGTSARSPEVFIPLAARDANPIFWGWPDEFTEDTSNPGKMDRSGVIFRMAGRDIEVNMMTWPAKSDFRLRSGALIEEMKVGDILRIERVEGESFQYYAEIVPQGTNLYDQYVALCINSVRNSKKKWGYY